jgi:GNAT superfamily N-acetyltransferase
MKIRIKKMPEKAYPLAYDSWILYLSSSNMLPRTSVDAGARKIIDRILTRPTTEVRAAVDADDQDKIRGIIVLDRTLGKPQEGSALVHWIYVKRDDRGYGISKALLEGISEVRAWWLGRGAALIARSVKVVYEPMLLAEI